MMIDIGEKMMNVFEEQKRIEWIDIYKGILIIFVVLGHTSGIGVKYIYLFHMSSFFFISGYTERLKEKSLSDLIKKKFSTLIIPYFCINILYVLLRILLEFIGLQQIYYPDIISIENIFEYIQSIFKLDWTPDLGGATWFLFALFIGFILSKILLICTRNHSLPALAIDLLLIIFVYIFNELGIYFKNYVDIGIIASIYVLLGVIFREKNFFRYLKIKNNIFLLITINEQI